MIEMDVITSVEAIALWEKTYGASFPTESWDWVRLAVRAGIPADKLWDEGRAASELLPFIEGYLLRQKDLKAEPLK